MRGLLAAMAAVLSSSACIVGVAGDFDGVQWLPDTSVMAIADRHDLLERNGSVEAVKRSDDAQRVHLLLSGAAFDARDDMRRLTTDELLEIRRTVALADGLLLKDLPLPRLKDGSDLLVAVVDDGVAQGDNDFDLAVAQALPPQSAVEAQGLGARVSVTLQPKNVDAPPHGGSVSFDAEVKRERSAGQDGDVAVGTVQLTVTAGFLPERLAEANLTLLEPIVRCAQQRGPGAGGACKDVDPLPYVDETGVVE